MDLKRCANGHFYDGEKFSFCPHCQGGNGAAGNETIPFQEAANNNAGTVTMPGINLAGGVQQTVPMTPPSQPAAPANPPKPAPPSDDAKTVGFFGNIVSSTGKAEQVQPVVGWMVCTKGKHIGKDFRLKAGRNFIGRNPNMDIALDGENTVSREGHAVIAYEPHQSIFIAQPGSASELFYLNGNVVLSATQIRRNDRLQLGEVELMLIPCCDENFKWELENTDKE